MLNPLISVMICVYNREKYIKEAVDSVIAQDYHPLEVIVVDDGSIDGTAEIVKQYDPKIVKYYYQENAGHAKARNVCVEKSKGEYLAWLDSDDYYLPGKLTAQMKYLREHPECEIVFTHYENFYENEESKTFIKESYFMQMNPNFDSVNDRCCPVTMLAPREVILRIGPRNESLKVGEDMEWLNRARIIYGISVLHCTDAVYMRRRLHKNNLCFERFSPASDVLLKKTIAGHMRSKMNV